MAGHYMPYRFQRRHSALHRSIVLCFCIPYVYIFPSHKSAYFLGFVLSITVPCTTVLLLSGQWADGETCLNLQGAFLGLHQRFLQSLAWWKMKGEEEKERKRRRGGGRGRCEELLQHTLLDPQPEEIKGAWAVPAVSLPAAAHSRSCMSLSGCCCIHLYHMTIFRDSVCWQTM